MRPDLRVLDDPAQAAAELLAGATGEVAITGGSTPRRAYELAAGMRDDWSSVDLWFTDERCVAPEHEHSNFGMASAALGHPARMHRMRGELGPSEGAAAYERELHAALGDGIPELDLILLGMGPDAHICSLFPHDEALGERDRPVVGVGTPGMAPLVARITLTLPVVNAARRIVLLVTGEDKAPAVRRALGPTDPAAPASLVEGEVTWLLDAAAAP